MAQTNPLSSQRLPEEKDEREKGRAGSDGKEHSPSPPSLRPLRALISPISAQYKRNLCGGERHLRHYFSVSTFVSNCHVFYLNKIQICSVGAPLHTNWFPVLPQFAKPSWGHFTVSFHEMRPNEAQEGGRSLGTFLQTSLEQMNGLQKGKEIKRWDVLRFADIIHFLGSQEMFALR